MSTIHIIYHPPRGPGHKPPAGDPAFPIGERTPLGNVLDKAALGRLCHVDRLHAYLLSVWPAARSTLTLARVCHVPYRSIATLLRQHVHGGQVARVQPGWYRATPTAPPAHVSRQREGSLCS